MDDSSDDDLEIGPQKSAEELLRERERLAELGRVHSVGRAEAVQRRQFVSWSVGGAAARVHVCEYRAWTPPVEAAALAARKRALFCQFKDQIKTYRLFF